MSSAPVEILGIRHFSPACARLVQARLAALQPRTVLVEGPSDFNPRLAELALPHQLPIALYSHASGPAGTRWCHWPLVEFAPEWQALQGGFASNATVRFIDLPYWHPDGFAHAARPTVAQPPGRERYARVQASLARRHGIEGDDALWDHLFEQDSSAETLAPRLHEYFELLRGAEPGSAADQAREAHMAQWIAWAAAGEPVLVVCGGWHQAALAARWPMLAAPRQEPQLQPPAEIERSGSFLVPYDDRRLDAHGGYGAGLASPMYYRWLWRHGTASAAERAFGAIVERLRGKHQQLPTAALIAAQARSIALAALRGHVHPLRCDVLDGLLDALAGGDALATEPPWSRRQALTAAVDPALREALLALTGTHIGTLAAGTPQPPLVHDVTALLAALELQPGSIPHSVRLDRRQPPDEHRAAVLWRLHLLGIAGFEPLSVSAPGAGAVLDADQHWLEQWRLAQPPEQAAQLVEAGAWGPTLELAALAKLAEDGAGTTSIERLAERIVQGLRAGYRAFGADAAARLGRRIGAASDHGALAAAGLRFAALVEQGFGNGDPATLLAPLLEAICTRLAWLLEGRSGHRADPADSAAVRLLHWSARRQADPRVAESIVALLRRCAAATSAPPALRGAAFGALWQLAAAGIDESAISQAAGALPDAVQLGDFLAGLFALARTAATRAPALVAALDRIITALDEHAFLVALPALRGAFAWFPPRERAELAQQVGRLHGSDATTAAALLQLPVAPSVLLAGSRLEQQVDGWLLRYGLQAAERRP